MTKAFHTLVDDRTDVSVETGLRAAEKLQSVLDERDHGIDILQMRVELGRIIAAIKSTVPESMWGDLVRKLDGIVETNDCSDHHIEDVETENEEYDPLEFTEIEDDL